MLLAHSLRYSLAIIIATFGSLTGGYQLSGFHRSIRVNGATRLFAKGFGKVNPPPIKKVAPVTERSAEESKASNDGPSTETYDEALEARGFLAEMQARTARDKESAEQSKSSRLNAIAEVEATLKENPTAGIIPDKVSWRMLKRMIPLGLTPIVVGVGLFAYFYISATKGETEFQPSLVAYATTAPWLLGLAGFTYGIMSTSWDEDVEGSALGLGELKLNVMRIAEGLRRTSDTAKLRNMQEDSEIASRKGRDGRAK